MVLEPGVAKDHALLPEIGDSEERPFGVGLITEDYIHHFRDSPCFIRGAVYVEHWYRTRDALGTDTFCTDKIFVYEVAGGSGVQKRFDRRHLTGVGGTNLDRQGRMIDIPWASRVLVESHLGSLFSHLGL